VHACRAVQATPQEEGGSGWVEALLRPLLELVFQNVVMGGEERLLQQTEAVWQLLLQVGPVGWG
jgi:hypothetical protein